MNIKSLFFKALKRVTDPLRGTGLMSKYPALKLFHNAYKALYNASKPAYIFMRGKKFYLDPEDSLEVGRQGEAYEKETADVFKKYIKQGNTVIDVGANIGFFTRLAADLVGSKGRVFAFEPNPYFFRVLEKNAQEIHRDNVEVFQKALSDRVTTAEFLTAGVLVHEGSSAGAMVEIGAGQKIVVETETLDNFFKTTGGSVDFLKMDIEGSELLALRGASLMLENNPKLKLVLEFNPRLLKVGGTDPAQFLSFLTERGFVFRDIEEGNGLSAITSEDLLKKYTAETYPDHTNILCIRESTA